MLISFRVRRAAVAAIAALLVAQSLVAQTPARGLTGNISMTLQPPALGGSGAPNSSLTGTVLLATGKGRIDIASASGPALDFRAGDFALLPDSSRLLYLRPSSQEFWNMDSPFFSPYAQLLASAGQVTTSGGRAWIETLGAGDSLSGFATLRFRISSEYTVTAGGANLPAGFQIDLTVAQTPVKFGSAPVAGAQTFGIAVPAAMMNGIRTHLAAATAGGVVVATVSKSWFVTSGTEISTIVTTRITDLRATDVDDAKLAMPTGFRAGGG